MIAAVQPCLSGGGKTKTKTQTQVCAGSRVSYYHKVALVGLQGFIGAALQVGASSIKDVGY